MRKHTSSVFVAERPKKGAGFTLIELLVVIAILAVLATAVIIVLNPAELIKQARDTTRISDLAALNSSIALYFADFANPVIGTGATGFCTATTTGTGKGNQACTVSTSTAVTNAGWVPIRFTDISSGSPLARLPMDPNNGSPNCGAGADACFYQYSFASSSLTFEINASMESAKYSTSTTGIEVKDGGNNSNAYEIGNHPGLSL